MMDTDPEPAVQEAEVGIQLPSWEEAIRLPSLADPDKQQKPSESALRRARRKRIRLEMAEQQAKSSQVELKPFERSEDVPLQPFQVPRT